MLVAFHEIVRPQLDRRDIRAAFAEYDRVRRAGDDAGVIRLSSKNSIDYLGSWMLTHVKTADRERMAALSTWNQAVVLVYRARLDRALLKNGDASAIYAALVHEKLLILNSNAMQLGEIDLDRSEGAAAEVFVGGVKQNLKIWFYREGGTWRVDTRSQFPFIEGEVDAERTRAGIDKAAMAARLFQKFTGYLPSDELWEMP